MIRIEGRAVTFGELWFAEEPDPASPVDILIYRHRPVPIEHRACSAISTLVNDLTIEESELLRRFGSTTRYEIKRAESKDGLDAAVVAPTGCALSSFIEFYNTFAKAKSLAGAYRRGLFAAAAAGQLVLTRASSAGEILVWHAYILWRSSAALLHSASHFRDRSNAERALVGRANRWLHWKDMVHFKRTGLQCYDWGGLFSDESSADRAGVNRFKYDFGGKRVGTYDCTMPMTMRGRLYVGTRAFLDRVRF